MCRVVPDELFQRQHYDDIVRSRRPTRWGLSCGYRDRYDPALLDRRPALRRAWARLLDRLLPRYVESTVFSMLLEASASEHSARRRAMKAATENAEELIRVLTRIANRARQAEITTEIS